MKKIIALIIGVCGITFLGITFSPLQYDLRKNTIQIKSTIQIDAPIQKIFNYLGQSKNASIWSTYVDHISPLNPNTIADGQVGSIRRCYKEASENGIIWDEQIIALEKNKYRRISIYNMKDFLLTSNALITEQNYASINDSSTALSLSLVLKPNASLSDIIKFHIAAYKVNQIFIANLKNIKYYNER
jgi:uncharacterized membrane protein